MAIYLGLMLPSGSSDLPRSSGGPPSDAPLFGLAPGGVYQAPIVTNGTGELLPHPFTLTRYLVKISGGLLSVALSACHQAWALPSTLPCGARTFLPSAHAEERPSVLLQHILLNLLFFFLISFIVTPVYYSHTMGTSH